jgi:hypothetical protein
MKFRTGRVDPAVSIRLKSRRFAINETETLLCLIGLGIAAALSSNRNATSICKKSDFRFEGQAERRDPNLVNPWESL